MRLAIVSPEKFAEWFNVVVPGAYRKINNQDIRDMCDVGLIHKYQYFGRSDLEIVRGILLYEQLRDERSRKENTIRTCKRCGQSLPSQTDGRKGRPNEYCPDCQPFRSRERYRKWRTRQTSLLRV